MTHSRHMILLVFFKLLPLFMSNDLDLHFNFYFMPPFLHSYFVFNSLIFKVPVTTVLHKGSFEIKLMMLHVLGPGGVIFF